MPLWSPGAHAFVGLPSWVGPRHVQRKAGSELPSVHRKRMKRLETSTVPAYDELEFRLAGRSYSKGQKALRRRLDKLRDQGDFPDSTLLGYCGDQGMLSEVLQALNEMRDAGVQVPFASNEAALQACVPAARWEQALSLLVDHWDAVKPERALGLVVQACRIGAWEPALQLLDLAGHQALSLDSAAYAGAMWACLEPSRPRSVAAEDALTLYQEFIFSGEPTGVAFWKVAARACEEGLLWERAMEMISERSDLPQVRLSVLRTCAQVAQWQRAVELLSDFKGDGASLMTAYCATIMACQHEECWEEATALLEEVQELKYAMAETSEGG